MIIGTGAETLADWRTWLNKQTSAEHFIGDYLAEIRRHGKREVSNFWIARAWQAG
jgi:hypothetical protein